MLTLTAAAAVENPPEVQQDSLLLSGDFTDEMMEMYSPVRQKVSEADGKAAMPQSNRNFPVKFLNIVDPLLPTNNLGRSVSKASFARIRKALAHGAQSLSSIIAKVPVPVHTPNLHCVLHARSLHLHLLCRLHLWLFASRLMDRYTLLKHSVPVLLATS